MLGSSERVFVQQMERNVAEGETPSGQPAGTLRLPSVAQGRLAALQRTGSLNIEIATTPGNAVLAPRVLPSCNETPTGNPACW